MKNPKNLIARSSRPAPRRPAQACIEISGNQLVEIVQGFNQSYLAYKAVEKEREHTRQVEAEAARVIAQSADEVSRAKIDLKRTENETMVELYKLEQEARQADRVFDSREATLDILRKKVEQGTATDQDYQLLIALQCS